MVRDADADEPIASAEVSLLAFPTTFYAGDWVTQSSTTTDANGRFVITYPVPLSAWTGFTLRVTRTGIDTALIATMPVPALDTVLKVYRTPTIRPGESIEFSFSLQHSTCGDDYPCRRLVVESPTGADVDLEVTPLDDGDSVRLVRTPNDAFSFTHYLTRMTAPPGPIWVISYTTRPSLGRTRLTATLRQD